MKKSFDRHLNIFWSYNGRPYLEDNLTRAFIITLSSLEKLQQIEFINWFIEDKLEVDEIDISFDLQNPYLDVDREIKRAKKRVLVGFNPTGKSFGNEKYSILNNIESYKFEIEKLNSDKYKTYLKNKLPLEMSEKLEEVDEFGNSYIEKIKDIILSYLNRGSSRPDAWIFIHKNKTLELVIAIETKLWDLNPEQLANHCKKCLDISKEEVKYKRFKETFDELKKIKTKNNNMVLHHFLDYMEKIGYYTNLDMITMEDFDGVFALQEEDSKLGKELLNRKFSNYFDSYFKSKEYKHLKEKYSLKDKNLNKRWINIKCIGEKGLGNIYFDTYFEKNRKILFFIGTEIGVANSWNNKLFSEKLKDEKFKNSLNILYPQNPNSLENDYESIFEIFFRVNQCSYSEFIYLNESNNLNEILNLKNQIPFESKLTRVQCAKKLKKYLGNNNNQLKKMESRGKIDSTATNYNIISYLRFVDYVKLDYIVKTDEKEFNIKFSKILEKHLNGLEKINHMLHLE